MLELLHIENIAVIEKADVEFAQGLNVLTGETGAGKSIVIDAINAVAGGRISKEIVRTGAAYALATGVFSIELPETWYDEHGIEPEEDGQLIITRRITAEGKNTCRVNGIPVSVAQLRELGGMLVDIHGQNDGRKLLDESYHLKYLDNCIGDDELLRDYADRYARMCEIKAELERLDIDEGEKERKSDMLRFKIDELERACIQSGELQEKQERRELLKNASRLTDAVDSAMESLFGSDRADGAITLTEEAERALEQTMRYSDKLGEISSKLTDARYAIMDAAEEIRDFRDQLDFSPGELDETEERISLIKRLMRKYSADEEGLISGLEEAKLELDDMEYSDERKEELERELSKARISAEQAAKKLSDARISGGKALEEKIRSELAQLSMKNVKFKVSIEKKELSSTGWDSVRFLMSANAGEEPGRISKIASGGELSRIMLAMKNVLAENDDVGTMVFDEIDTGVSGIAAQRVGEKLWELSVSRQVLCVTHLPQIAVMADRQFSVDKDGTGDRTFTRVLSLDERGRTGEIARLTGGDNITENTLVSAREQLEAAEQFKEKYMKA